MNQLLVKWGLSPNEAICLLNLLYQLQPTEEETKAFNIESSLDKPFENGMSFGEALINVKETLPYTYKNLDSI